ncbi:MAG: T9SS type A sorting domain-containing protein [Salibacteraceae bacterium]
MDGSRYRCLVQGTCFPNDTVFSDVALLTVLTDTILSGTVWNSDTSIGLGGIQVDALDTLGTSLFSGSVASTDPNGSYEIPVTDDPAFLWANVTPVFPNLLPTYWGDTFLVQGASSILYNSCRISGLDIHCDTILFSTSIGSGSGGGYVSQTQGSGKQNGLVPIEDLNILLVDESDSVITSERTDADGYFYFDSLELGKDYFLWADYPFVNFDSVPQLLVLDSLEAFREQVYFLDEGIILRFLYTDISVEELSDDWPLKLFPNPSLGHLYVEGLDESATFQLFDLQGNVRMEAPIYPGNRTIQLPEGLSGFYLIEVRTQHRVKQFRVLLL